MRISLLILLTGLPVFPLLGQAPAAPAPPASSGSETVARPGTIFESPQNWPSTAFLPGANIPGNGWQINGTVHNDGLYNTWGVSSQYGPYQITGNERLLQLLREIEATQKLNAMSKTKEFGEAMKKAGIAQLQSAKRVLSDPVDTVSKIPEGASRFFGRVGNTVKHTVQGNLDIDQDATPEEKARKLFGVDKAKRQLAAQLGVSPWTSNAALQKALNDVASVQAAGTLTMDIGKSLVVPPVLGGVMTGINVTNSLTQEQIAASPKDLTKQNRAKAVSLGVPGETADAFAANVFYDPWDQTFFWNTLAQLPGLNATIFVEKAASASSPLDAFFFLRTAQLMALYHQRVAPLQEMVALPHTVACVQTDGALMVPLWVDYAIWTPQAEAAAKNLQQLAEQRQASQTFVVTTGYFSQQATQELKARGIETVPHVLAPSPK